jgi:hypothetical protein
MPGLVSTSIAEELGRTAEPPTTEAVQRAATTFAEALGRALGAEIDWVAREAIDAVEPGTSGESAAPVAAGAA